jgi:chloramphenicol O-acetyltransferase
MEVKTSFSEKIAQLTEELQTKCVPYNMQGDDKTLSELTIEFSQKVQNLVGEEIKAIQEGKESANEKKMKLVKLREEIRNISWLPKGFQSSISMQIIFASAKII